MLAPPWLPVPPPGYGGVEAVVALLCQGLVARGHDVTLFAAPGSHSPATVRHVLPHAYPHRIERALHEVDHVARVFDAVDEAAAQHRPFDLIHDHSGFTGFAMAARIATPLLHTLHGPFTADISDFYRHHATNAATVAISASQRATAPRQLKIAAVIPNPIDVAAWPYRTLKQDYLLWIGRVTETKGPHRAIAAARAAGVPLVLAGPVQPGQEAFFAEAVAPHLDGRTVSYVGEVGGEVKRQLFAEARGLLMPIDWPEPFGLVMIEALSCGTPVIAYPAGAAPEIVQHGITGYLVDDETQMTAAISLLDRIDPAACRAQALTRYDIGQVTIAYEAVYRRVLTDRTPPVAGNTRYPQPLISVAGRPHRTPAGKPRPPTPTTLDTRTLN